MQKDSEFKEHVETLRHKATVHPFLKWYCEVGVREGLFSDAVSAIGRLHDTLVQAAYPEMIGRSIITVRPTASAGIRLRGSSSVDKHRRTVIEVRADLHKQIRKLALLNDLRIYAVANALIEETLRDQERVNALLKKLKM
jgi:hypothetical protein